MLKQKHILMCFGVLALIIPLYWAKTKADSKFEHMRDLRAEVEKTDKAVHALEAELAYLERYDRIEKSSTELGLVPQNPIAIKSLSDLDAVAPIINENAQIINSEVKAVPQTNTKTKSEAAND